MYWEPYSLYNLGDRTPRFLAEATAKDKAVQLSQVLRVDNIEELRNHIAERFKNARHPYYDPMRSGILIGFNAQNLGSQ